MDKLFLSLLVVLLQVITARSEEEGTENCTSKSWHGVYERVCCDSDPYTLGHQLALEKYGKECNVEPPNQTLGYGESMWVFLECIFRKSLAPSASLNAKTFAQIMAQNMTESFRAKVLAAVDEYSKSGAPAKTNSVKMTKALWEVYFDAEYQVCHNGVSMDSTETDWDPSSTCNGTVSPDIYPIHLLPSEWDDCIDRLTIQLDPYNATQSQIMSICTLISLTGLNEDDLLEHKQLDFDLLMASAMPKMLSKGTKSVFQAWVLRSLHYWYPQTEGLSSFNDIGQKLSELDASKETSHEGGGDKSLGPKNWLIMEHLVQALHRAFHRICSDDKL